MLSRMRLLKGATALLYAGPLFAGMCGFGWGLVAAFTAIFVVWLMVLRPEQWPSAPDEWLTGGAWLSVATQILSQVALIAILFGIGRGIGALAGFVPVVNPVLPLSVSFLAIPLCRMLWDAREAADQGYFLDDEAEAAHAPRVAAEAGTAIIPLLNLPDDTPAAKVNEAISLVLSVPTAELRLRALIAALSNPARNHLALRQGLMLWCSEPEVVAPGHVPNAMSAAFAFAAGSPDLQRLYVPRALALIGTFPNRADGFPSPAKLREAAVSGAGLDPNSDLPAHLRADLRDGLRALALAVETALTQTGDAATTPGEELATPAARTA